MNETQTGRKPLKTDLHVGTRMRLRRKMLRLSQTDLAESLGLTFQQIQKYERGANRVSASTLYEAAKVLQVSVGYFFDGLPATVRGSDTAESDAATDLTAKVATLLALPEGLELVERFPAIRRGEARRQILALAKTLGELPSRETPSKQGVTHAPAPRPGDRRRATTPPAGLTI